MKMIIILLSKFLYFFGKIFGKNMSLPGKLALKMDSLILKKIKLPGNIIMVTGSNGKTSTTEMISKILISAGFSVCCNFDSNNQIEENITTILKNTTINGTLKKDVLLIQCDESSVSQIIKNIKPKYLVITNIYRQKLRKNGHPELVYDHLNKVLTQDIHLILNTDDPLSSLYGYKRENVTYFGVNKNSLSNINNISRYDDTKYCPNCKSAMQYKYYHFNHIGCYQCEKCGHSRKEPNYEVTNYKKSIDN
ncbi:MAG: hypothetical protein IJ220_06645 [Clostridia bacterium]|nr:hypothetical protein [Clostridia bacterium]